MYKAVIFDLDGTLLDSLNDILFVLNDTLTHFGLPQITREDAKSYIGNGARELVRLAIGAENGHRLDEILAYYKEKYAQSDNGHSRIYDGADKALKVLKCAGVKLAVLTNKPHAAALTAEKIFLKHFVFDIVQGQIDGVPLKPNPQSVYSIIDQLGVEKGECLFVGDGEADVETAKNAGINCVSVLWGYRSKEQLKAAGATAFAENYDELLKVVLS